QAEAARRLIEQTVLLWQEFGEHTAAMGLTNLAYIAMKQGDYATARITYKRTLEVFQSCGDIRGMAYAWNGLGDVAMAEGDYMGECCHYWECMARIWQLKARGGTE